MAMVREMWRVPMNIEPWWPGVKRGAEHWKVVQVSLVGRKLMTAPQTAEEARPSREEMSRCDGLQFPGNNSGVPDRLHVPQKPKPESRIPTLGRRTDYFLANMLGAAPKLPRLTSGARSGLSPPTDLWRVALTNFPRSRWRVDAILGGGLGESKIYWRHLRAIQTVAAEAQNSARSGLQVVDSPTAEWPAHPTTSPWEPEPRELPG